MTRVIRHDDGFTLIELVVAMGLALVIFGAVVFLFTGFLHDTTYSQARDDGQDNARSMIDRLSRELRDAATPTVGQAGLLEKATYSDLVFQTVSPTTGVGTGSANQIRVRYCLAQNTNPNQDSVLWRQTETTVGTVVPDTTTCPSSSNSWTTTTAELSDVANTTSDQLFCYSARCSDPVPATSQIKEVEVQLFINPNVGHSQPGTTELTSGIYLRNELSTPTCSPLPTASVSGPDVILNGSSCSDPNGQTLTYKWYTGTGCVSTNAISGATTQQYTAGPYTTGTYSFSMQVTDTAGLSSSCTQTNPSSVTIS